jgi:hypothetical protein
MIKKQAKEQDRGVILGALARFTTGKVVHHQTRARLTCPRAARTASPSRPGKTRGC